MESGTPKRLHFDPTINAGHVLTFIGMAFALFVGWSNLDKRVVTLEEQRAHQALRDASQDALVGQQLIDIKESLREMRVELRAAAVELRKDRKP